MTLRLFEGWGIEIELMIVGRESLDVLPVSDRVLEAVAGEITAEVEVGELAWSNELVLHVVELKTNGPAARLEGLKELFLRDVRRIDAILEPLGGRLLGSGMHPWMDPETETRLWPHEWNAVYESYDRIFGCRGHGWSNLQSIHVNLPFAGDDELGRLHAAIRLVLPLLPALAASSPFADGRATGFLDTRLEHYRRNSARVPSVAGDIVPEPVWTKRDYETEILGRMYRDIAPLDPDGVLQHEFLNSRGAIVRFDRDAIEIRLIDVQEHPGADLAIAALVGATVRALSEERWSPLARQQAQPTAPLAALLRRTIAEAEETPIEDRELLGLLGRDRGPMPARALWTELAEELPGLGPWQRELATILERGTLARRLLAASGPEPSRERLREVYGRLAASLTAGEAFLS